MPCKPAVGSSRMFPPDPGPWPTTPPPRFTPSRPAIRCITTATCTYMGRRRTTSTSTIRQATWERTCGMTPWCSAPAGGTQAGSVDIGMAGPTWGFGFEYGYFGGGWIWRPNGFWWYHNGPFMGRVYNEHWNPHWNPADREKISNNVNVYNRW